MSTLLNLLAKGIKKSHSVVLTWASLPWRLQDRLKGGGGAGPRYRWFWTTSIDIPPAICLFVNFLVGRWSQGGRSEVGGEGLREERDHCVRARKGGEGGVEMARRAPVSASQGPPVAPSSDKALLLTTTAIIVLRPLGRQRGPVSCGISPNAVPPDQLGSLEGRRGWLGG